MPKKINLLTPELAVSKDIARAAKIIKRLSLVGVVLTMFVGVLGILVVVYYTNKLRSIQSQNESLQASINSLESEEEGLILVKDRVQKIQTLLNSREREKTFLKQKTIVGSIPQGMQFKSLKLEAGQSDVELLASSSIGLEELLTSLAEESDFSELTLSSVSFNPYRGYTLSLSVY
jgi:Tfp pilus assembly protein PilN